MPGTFGTRGKSNFPLCSRRLPTGCQVQVTVIDSGIWALHRSYVAGGDVVGRVGVEAKISVVGVAEAPL
jgi:hypothetical protein